MSFGGLMEQEQLYYTGKDLRGFHAGMSSIKMMANLILSSENRFFRTPYIMAAGV